MDKYKQKLTDEITDRCEQAGCDKATTKKHIDAYVNHRWNPHPPIDWLLWWSKHPESDSIPTVIAYNTERYRIQWHIARLANLTHAQASRIDPLPRATNPDILMKHAQFLVRKGELKKEDVEHWVYYDPMRELLEAIKKEQPLRPILARMIWLTLDGKQYSVLDDPPKLTREGWFQKAKEAVARIGKKMPDPEPFDYDRSDQTA